MAVQVIVILNVDLRLLMMNVEFVGCDGGEIVGDGFRICQILGIIREYGSKRFVRRFAPFLVCHMPQSCSTDLSGSEKTLPSLIACESFHKTC